MGRSLGFIGLILALAIGGWLYQRQAQSLGPAGNPGSLAANTELIRVKNQLIAIANAERRQLASDGKYKSLDELQANGDISSLSGNRGQYSFSVEISGNTFRATATRNPSADQKLPASLSIGETMKITQE